MRGSRREGGGSGGSGPPLKFATLDIADITGNEKNSLSYLFFIFVHFHSYTSRRINSQNNNQIISIQVCVMGFFLLKVGPPLEKSSGSAPAIKK